MSRPKYQGKLLMSVCAGMDIPDFVQAFGSRFDTFLFVDLKYDFSRLVLPSIDGWVELSGTRRIVGKQSDRIRHVEAGESRYREIEPAWMRVNYKNKETGKDIELCFRRGFGQYALHELEDGSLSMFVHRGDSRGEGGSNTFFLANRRATHQPLSRLFDVIKTKLAPESWIVSDGSNCDISQLRRAAGNSEEVEQFQWKGLRLEREMSLEKRVNSPRTVVWRVTPIP